MVATTWLQVTGDGWTGTAGADSVGNHVLTKFGAYGTVMGQVIISLKNPPAVYAQASAGQLPDGLALVLSVDGTFDKNLTYLVRHVTSGGEQPATCPAGKSSIDVPYTAVYSLFSCPHRDSLSPIAVSSLA